MSNAAAVVLHLEPLARDDLEHVAGLDVFLAVPDYRFIGFARQVGLRPEGDGAVGVDVREREVGARRGQASDQLVYPPGRAVVGRLQVAAGLDVGMGDHEDRLPDVIEQDHPVIEGERQVGEVPVVGRGVGEVLGIADRVVSGVADRPAHESRQAGDVHGPIGGEEALEVEERVGRVRPGGSIRIGRVDDSDPIAPRLEPAEGLGPEEAVPADLLATRPRFRTKRMGRNARSSGRPTRASGRRWSVAGKPGCRRLARPGGRSRSTTVDARAWTAALGTGRSTGSERLGGFGPGANDATNLTSRPGRNNNAPCARRATDLAARAEDISPCAIDGRPRRVA